MPLFTSQSCHWLVTAPLTQSVMSWPRQVISKVFHSPAGLTREAVCCLDRLNRLGAPLLSVVPNKYPPEPSPVWAW